MCYILEYSKYIKNYKLKCIRKMQICFMETAIVNDNEEDKKNFLLKNLNII